MTTTSSGEGKPPTGCLIFEEWVTSLCAIFNDTKGTANNFEYFTVNFEGIFALRWDCIGCIWLVIILQMTSLSHCKFNAGLELLRSFKKLSILHF